MPRNVYHSFGIRSEQLFHEDLIVEAISIHGQNFFYIPRTLIGKDEILGEDRLSQFKSAYGIEMYLENVDGFEGQGAFIQKFGLMMEQSATLTVARRRWEQLVGRFGKTILPNRPAEGDLLYFPLTGGLFEIKFVTHQDPFYQAGKLYVYKLQVELFQYASEKIDTGIKEIDVFENLKSFDIDIVKNGQLKKLVVVNKGLDYLVPPTVKIGSDWVANTNIIVGQEVCYAGKRYIATTNGTTSYTPPSHSSGIMLNGTTSLEYFGTRATATAVLGDGTSAGEVVEYTITHAGSGYTHSPMVTITSNDNGRLAEARAIIENLDNQDSYGDNNKFREEGSSIIFNESNPFGDLGFDTAPPQILYTSDSLSIFSDSTTITADAA